MFRVKQIFTFYIQLISACVPYETPHSNVRKLLQLSAYHLKTSSIFLESLLQERLLNGMQYAFINFATVFETFQVTSPNRYREMHTSIYAEEYLHWWDIRYVFLLSGENWIFHLNEELMSVLHYLRSMPLWNIPLSFLKCFLPSIHLCTREAYVSCSSSRCYLS